MKAVITVIGKDTIGILSKVSVVCATHQINIIDVSQTVLQDLFAMIMLVEVHPVKQDLAPLRQALQTLEQTDGLQIHVMHEDIFNSMHRI